MSSDIPQLRAAGQLNAERLSSAKFCLSPNLGKIWKSVNKTAPIGINIRPYNITKSSSFITRAGKQAAIVVISPAARVTFQRFQFGVTVCKARPARYRVGFAVVHPAITTQAAPAIPAPIYAIGPGAIVTFAAAHRIPEHIQAT